MNIIHIPADSRGQFCNEWLHAKYSFSFNNYYDSERVHFGVLRVLNDDLIAPSKGFSTHPHEEMEIITIPLSGALAHKDSTGGEGVIEAGDVQVMSAGTGIFHSEFNPSHDTPVSLLQIWIFPNQRGVKPRYQQKRFSFIPNQWTTLVAPFPQTETLGIYQQAWIQRGHFDANQKVSYKSYNQGNGLYLFLIEGKIDLQGLQIERRDALQITEIFQPLTFKTLEPSQILLMDLPMHIH